LVIATDCGDMEYSHGSCSHCQTGSDFALHGRVRSGISSVQRALSGTYYGSHYWIDFEGLQNHEGKILEWNCLVGVDFTEVVEEISQINNLLILTLLINIF